MSEIAELEVLTLCRGELTTRVNTHTQVVNNTIVAIQSRISLATCHEMRVTILELTRTGNHLDSFEIYRTFVPAKTFFVQSHQYRSSRFLSSSSISMDGLLLFEVLHCGSFSFNNNKVYAWAYLITLGVENITGSIVANVFLKRRVHSYLFNIGQKSNGIIDIRDKNLTVKIS